MITVGKNTCRPKSIASVTFSMPENASASRFARQKLMEFIRANDNSDYFLSHLISDEDAEILNKVRAKYQELSLKGDYGVLITVATDRNKETFKKVKVVNIYILKKDTYKVINAPYKGLLESDNFFIKDGAMIVNYDLSDVHVYSYVLMTHSEKKDLKVVAHPKEIEVLQKEGYFTINVKPLIEKSSYGETQGVSISFKDNENFEMKDWREKVKQEIDEDLENKIVSRLHSRKSASRTQVSLFTKKGYLTKYIDKQALKGKSIDEMKEGKYAFYDSDANRSMWMLISDYKSVLGNKREVFIVAMDDITPEVEKMKRIIL